jgi:hypothetical protein
MDRIGRQKKLEMGVVILFPLYRFISVAFFVLW